MKLLGEPACHFIIASVPKWEKGLSRKMSYWGSMALVYVKANLLYIRDFEIARYAIRPHIALDEEAHVYTAAIIG